MWRLTLRKRTLAKAGNFVRVLGAISLALQAALPVLPAPVRAGPVPEVSAVFTGDAGTVLVGSTLYARSGGALTLNVTTSADTRCVAVSGDFVGLQGSGTAKSTWTFSFAATAGNGVKTITASAHSNYNSTQNKCTGTTTGSGTASFILDNTGPNVTAALSPAPNAAGWNNGDVGITWSATDGGSGVGSGPTPATDSVTESSAGLTRTATATDRLGNAGSGSVTVKLDKVAPTITGSRSPAANADGWNNTDVEVGFQCSDAPSGIKSCTGSSTLAAEGANQAVEGMAVDNADNSAGTTVSGINIDKTAPTLSGAPTIGPNAAGWYNGDVTVHWTAADALSGVAAVPADSTIFSEGTGLTAGASVSDRAGNTTGATSSPAVKIDRTAPNTTATAPANWNNTDVTVSLNALDALSGVAATYYKLDGGAQESGTSVAISAEGVHDLQFWSVDNAGNTEAARTVQVKIDRTPPTINHTQSPPANGSGWNNTDVTVTFTCSDPLSGVASCTAPQTVTAEGQNQPVPGEAVDNVGNRATDPATVSIDRTAPTISAAADRPANGNGWYKDDVTVAFSCADSLSGMAKDGCPASQTLGEGANQSASGTARDAADNTATAAVSGINVDKTAPALSGAATPPNGNGWYSGDVTIKWTASDALSGLDGSAPADTVITGEGDNLSAGAEVRDLAGNARNATVGGIKIDRSAPSSSASVPDPLPSGWYAGPVQVTIAGVDGLSGIDKSYYSVDGGDPMIYVGPFNHALKGSHSITFWSVDRAGNVEDRNAGGHTITLRIDDIAPSTGATVVPKDPNGTNGWYTVALNITLTAGDAESGVAATYYGIDGGTPIAYTGPFTFDQPGAHTITYWSVDNAGNVEDAAAKNNIISVQFDSVPPTISEKSRTPAANSFGWNNGDVTVSFNCTDATSDVASCPDLPFSNEGAGQEGTGVATDRAGNSASLKVTGINIDKTSPTLAGAATSVPNAAGWYKADVTIHWTGQDGLSGIDPSTQPADSVIKGEGSNLGAGPVTISDKAGNSSQPASISAIKIDRTAPTIAGATVNDDGTPRGANVSGWFNSAVRVRFTAGDSLSGIANLSGDVVLANDGTNQSAAGTATDYAGNSASTTVNGINIDSQAPQTSTALQCTGKNGWCRGNKATVVLTAADQAGLSGVKEIQYSTNGNSWKSVAGNSASVDLTLTGSGKATVRFYAVDNAGNKESQGGVDVKYDTIAPSVTHEQSPVPNSAGWNRSDVLTTFTASDDADGSGVELLKIDGTTVASQPKLDAPTLSGSKGVGTETGGQTIVAEAEDFAGNLGNDSVTVKLDKTAPTIGGAPTTGPNAAGWYNGPVTVKFDCADPLSGIATCTGWSGSTNNGVTLQNDGAGQSVAGSATDKAGNTATATVGGINIDSVKPIITVNGIAKDGIYTLGAVPAASCTATDAGSGVDGSCAISISGGLANGAGTFTFTATARDRAGNTVTLSGSYRVTYRWDGFLQPINDTAHQVDQSTSIFTTSIFKGGSTVPAKFQLKKADGTVLQANSLPRWLNPSKGSPTVAAVDESLYVDQATSGNAYRWDGTSQQYIYNWSTKGVQSGFYYRVGVIFDDGQTYSVNIGLR